MVNSQELLESFFNEKAKIGSKNYFFHCPKCNHHKRKLLIDKDHYQWHCWICEDTQNTKGRSLHSLFKFFNASEYYLNEASKIEGKKKKYHFNTNDINNKNLFNENDSINNDNDFEFIELPKEFKSFITYKHTDEFFYKKAFNYVLKRNIRLEDIVRYNIGYCDEGQYQNRIIIPSYDKFFRLNYFIARSFHHNSQLKYDNPTVDKTKIIWFESFLNWSLPITIVEGAFDSIPVRFNVTSLLGSSLNETHKLMNDILLKRPPQINIILDNDALDKAIYISEILLNNDINTKLIVLKDDKDPNDLGFNYLYNAIKETKILDFNTLMKLKLKF